MSSIKETGFVLMSVNRAKLFTGPLARGAGKRVQVWPWSYFTAPGPVRGNLAYLSVSRHFSTHVPSSQHQNKQNTNIHKQILGELTADREERDFKADHSNMV